MKQYDITIEAGADFARGFVLRDDEDQPRDLTGTELAAEFRAFAEAAEYIPFSVIHGGEQGRISLVMPHEGTSQIFCERGVYDCFILYPDGTREKVLQGNVTVSPMVTRISEGELMYFIAVRDEASLPIIGIANRIYYTNDTNRMYRWDGAEYISVIHQTRWGRISGDIEDQTDLQEELLEKINAVLGWIGLEFYDDGIYIKEAE